MTGDERIRLFCGLQLPTEALDELERWQAEHLQDGGRIVPRGNLHATLAFLGLRPAAEVPAIAAELAAAARVARPVLLEPVSYRETRSVGMIVCEDVTGAGAALAADVGERLERLGVYRREARPWLPHITVIRFRKPAGLRPPVGNICSIGAVRAALYASVLRQSGAQYEVLESVSLQKNLSPGGQ